MKIPGIVVAGLATLIGAAALISRPSRACGGFFCGQQPVDQQAERVIFAVDEVANQTTMIVQIAFQGSAADFAWVVPLGAVPVDGSLDTFPQLALSALDANTAPQIFQGGGCLEATAGAGPPSESDADDGVTVHVREEVGPYDVAVIESDDPEALVTWLRDNGFRVTTPMAPYIAEYTAEGMKFLALRLQPSREVNEIEPFRLTLPGTSPMLPLRMTALAAEPEMGIVIHVLGAQRYEGANWPNLSVPDDYLVFDWNRYRHNWTQAVARVVDEAGGQGWVTEMAGPTADYVALLERTTPADEAQAEAVAALAALLRPYPYMSRLYTRLSAEEMISDPILRRSAGADVPRWRDLPAPEGAPVCGWDSAQQAEVSPCDFTACGAGGRCVEVETADGGLEAGCACVPGATARTTFGPDGSVTVACQDRRMSFLNPGDRETPEATPLADPCVGFDCGGGTCVPMNMTPTCVCDQGLVATGRFDSERGARLTTCVAPREAVPTSFYDLRLPERPSELPSGREVEVPPVARPSDTAGGGGCAGGGAAGLGLALVGLLGLARRVGRPQRRR